MTKTITLTSNNKHLRSAIRTAERGLKWSVKLIPGGNTLEIISDHEMQSHTIHMPRVNTTAGPIRAIEYLHELGHAQLAETVGPVFAVHQFTAPGHDVDLLLPMLAGPVRATADWFVDDLLERWVPDAARAEIAEHVNLILGTNISDLSIDLRCGAALVIAQARYYNRSTIRNVDVLEPLVSSFLAMPPNKPKAQRFSTLFNSLLALTTSLTATWSDKEYIWIVSPR